MADPLWTVVRLLHVGAAIAWVGGATLWGGVLMPTLAQLGPTLPRGVLPTLGGKVVKFLPHAGATTLVTGILVFTNLMPFTSSAWRWLMLAALAVTAILVILAYAVMVPSFKKFSSLASAAQGPPPPEAMQLMGRIKQLSLASLAGGWLVVVLMVAATALRTT